MPLLYFLDRFIGSTSARVITSIKRITTPKKGEKTNHQDQSIILNSLATTNISVSKLKKLKLRVMLFLC
jgi:hypothetical protein